MNSRKGKSLGSKSTWWWMCGRFGTLSCMIIIYRSRKRKERCKVMVITMVKQNFKINGKKVQVKSYGVKSRRWKKCFSYFQRQLNIEHSKGHQDWNLPLVTKQDASLLVTNHWIHFKGHQVGVFPCLLFSPSL